MDWLLNIATLILIGLLYRQLRKVKNKQMSDETRLQALEGKLEAVSAGIAELKAQIARERDSNPAISDELDRIDAKVDAIVAGFSGPGPQEEGGGQTGGGPGNGDQGGNQNGD